MQRILALAILILVTAFIYFSAIHVPIISQLTSTSESIDSLKNAYSHYLSILSNKELLETEANALKSDLVNSGLVLTAADSNAASLQLMQEVSSRIKIQSKIGSGCIISNRVLLPFEVFDEIIKIQMSIELQCGFQALAETLFEIETAKPYLLIDSANIKRKLNAGNGVNLLTIKLVVYGFYFKDLKL